jgi:hypothetical protein
MNPVSRCFLVFATGLLLSAATVLAAPASGVPAPKKSTDRFERTKEHIDALLKNRLKPEPLPAVLPNPFQLAEAAPTNTSPTPGNEPTGHEAVVPVEAAPPGSDAEFLALYAATLKISGTVLLNGRLQLIINQSSYKEGDVIVLHNKETNIYLKIVHIVPGELTLGYNGVEQTVKFKGN